RERNAKPGVGEQPIAPRCAQHAGAHGISLAPIRPIADGRSAAFHLSKSLRCSVGRPVIHQNQLKGINPPAKVIKGSGNILLNLPRFVKTRNHHRKKRTQRRSSSTTRGSSMRGAGAGSSGSLALAGSKKFASIGSALYGPKSGVPVKQ